MPVKGRLNTHRKRIKVLFIIILVIAGFAGLTVENLRFARQNPGGNDFLVHWAGTRALLTEGISPYSDEVAISIQTIAYGRPALPGEHELRVAYPIYSIIFFSPFAAFADYNIARALWMTLLEISLVLTSIISIRLSEWQPNLLITFIFLLFTITWYHSVRALVNGNAIVLIALLITGVLFAIRSNLDELAGILLAFSTIKPQVVILFVPYVLFWAASQRRWRIILWTLGGVFILTIFGMIVLPDWIVQNLREVMLYPKYNPPGTPGAVFQEWWPGIGRQLGWILSIVLAIILAVVWRDSLGKGHYEFLWSAGMTLIISQWIGIQTDPGNFLVLILPFVYILASLKIRWRPRTAGMISIFLMLITGIGLWALFLATVGKGAEPQQNPIMFFPLPLFLIIGMFWVRKWRFFLSTANYKSSISGLKKV